MVSSARLSVEGLAGRFTLVEISFPLSSLTVSSAFKFRTEVQNLFADASNCSFTVSGDATVSGRDMVMMTKGSRAWLATTVLTSLLLAPPTVLVRAVLPGDTLTLPFSFFR